MKNFLDLYYDYIQKYGDYPKYLFISKDEFDKLVTNFWMGFPVNYGLSIEGTFMGLKVIEVKRNDFIWVG